MSLIRYHASPIATLFDELDELVPGGFDWTGRGLTGVTYPNVDIAETETGYTIKADLPGLASLLLLMVTAALYQPFDDHPESLELDRLGLAREDIKVNVADGVLSVSGEKKREVEKREKNRYYHFERSWGRFCRSFTLPTHVDGNNIEAKYTDGVLEGHLKKSAESKPKAIEVNGQWCSATKSGICDIFKRLPRYSR